MLPDKLETIEGSAFMECTELKKLDIPDTVTYIGDDAFGFCINLEHILLPSKINKISKELFISCYKLKDIDLPEMIQVIEDGAFKYCKILENIELNEKLTFLGEDVFNNTLWLENIKPDNYGCKYYKNILLCCNGQSPYVEIKSGTRIIAGGAFSLL